MSQKHNSAVNSVEEYDPTVWVEEQHAHGTKDIWKKFWILTFITFIDIAIYFTSVTLIPTGVKNFLFIVFGIVKAYYIVGTFMHLKHEKLDFKLTILLPVILIVYLVVLVLIEGDFTAFLRN